MMQIEFNEVQTKSLNAMSQQIGSKAEVLRKALSLLKVCIEETKQGNQIAFVKENKICKVVVLGR
jgi:hypothetical protein